MSQTRVGDGDLMLPAYCALMCQSLDPRQALALVPACDVVTGQLVRLTAGNEPRRFVYQFSFSSCEDLEVRGGQQEKGK